MTTPVRQRDAIQEEQRCPLCRDALRPRLPGSEPLSECPACTTVFHQACTAELGGCSTAGCVERGRLSPGRDGSTRVGECAACAGPLVSGHAWRCWECETLHHEACSSAFARCATPRCLGRLVTLVPVNPPPWAEDFGGRPLPAYAQDRSASLRASLRASRRRAGPPRPRHPLPTRRRDPEPAPGTVFAWGLAFFLGHVLVFALAPLLREDPLLLALAFAVGTGLWAGPGFAQRLVDAGVAVLEL